MARTPGDRNLSRRRLRSFPSTVPSYYKKAKKAAKQNEVQLTSEEKDWKHATCPICLERPHDAVLLLCSSHNKGCRPYMCGTNYHQSNCLEQFKNAYLKEKPTHEVSIAVTAGSKRPKDMELACPICRGEVKGWTVVESARQFLNRKRRTCTHEDCSFIGSYKKLCKHVKARHPSSKPCEVDPARLAEWKELESEKERQDAISIVTGLNPGAMIMGDYLIDPNSGSSDFDMESSDWSDSSDCYSSDGGDIMISEGAGIRSLRRAVRRAYRRNEARARRNVPIVAAGNSGIQRIGLTISRSSGRRRGLTNRRELLVGSARRRARSTIDS
uniref:Uncharacterized protein n=1 Tax=Avena sativa TaxID=4498 RepID=A0ACD5UWH6_AVESA